jgi:hypothetical protein
MSADVFISFASQDAKTASTICAAIENRGFKCWIATRDIMPGENFQSAIVRAIRSAKVLLLVFTANSNRSDEMTKELALASQQKLMVVPLRVENVDPSDAFAYEFATRQWIDLFADWELAMNNLCTRLSAALEDDRTHVDTIVLGKPSLQDPVAAKLALARRRRTRNVALAAGVVALVGAGALAVPRLMHGPHDDAGAAATAAVVAPAAATAPASAAAVAPAVTAAPVPPAAAAEAAPAATAGAAMPGATEAAAVPRPVKKTSSKKASSNVPY